MGKTQSKRASRDGGVDAATFRGRGDSLPIKSRNSQRNAKQEWLQDGVVQREVDAFLRRLAQGHFVAYREQGEMVLGVSNGDGTVRHEPITFINNTSCRLGNHPDQPLFETLNDLISHYQSPESPVRLVDDPEVMDLMVDYSQEPALDSSTASAMSKNVPSSGQSSAPDVPDLTDLARSADTSELNESLYGQTVISSSAMAMDAIIVEEGYGDVQRPVDNTIEMSEDEEEEEDLPQPPPVDTLDTKGFTLLKAAYSGDLDQMRSRTSTSATNQSEDEVLPAIPDRPSLAANPDPAVGMPEPLDLNAIAENAGVEEEDVAYLRPAMAGVAQDAEQDLDYQRLPDDHPNDIFHWARDGDHHLKDGAIQPLWIHSTYLDRNKAEALISSFGNFPGLFVVRARTPRTSKDKAIFCLTLRSRQGFEHHLISETADGKKYVMAGSRTLPTIESASDLSSILMQIASKQPSTLQQAITIPHMSRADVGGFPDFFHGKIDRAEAVRRLMTDGGGQEGYYLVRVSSRAGPQETADGEATFVLSCINKLKPFHHVLKRKKVGAWVLNDERILPRECVSLPDALAYFMEPRRAVSFILRSYVRRPPIYRLAKYGALLDEDDDLGALPPALEPPLRSPSLHITSPTGSGVIPPALPARNSKHGSRAASSSGPSGPTSPLAHAGVSEATTTTQAQTNAGGTFAALARAARVGDDDTFGGRGSKRYADANELFGHDDPDMRPGDMLVEGDPNAPPLMIPNLDEAQDLHQGVSTMLGKHKPSPSMAEAITFGFDNDNEHGNDSISLGSDIEFM
eukprot:TRINITY_DN6788_c0_g2_i1.p1 TRINITY_DN6788_c0_g2~~TRINITY_DN6788_c0_g2_i1.p1  ORF type:complete len:798 (+),score=190.09 TRINITY_DN6788_c0_g2_i1:114-2507(+)